MTNLSGSTHVFYIRFSSKHNTSSHFYLVDHVVVLLSMLMLIQLLVRILYNRNNIWVEDHVPTFLKYF